MAAAEAHPPALFPMLPMAEYQLLLAYIYPFLFCHLGHISPYLLAQFECYLDYEFFYLYMFPAVSLEAIKRCWHMIFGVRHAWY